MLLWFVLAALTALSAYLIARPFLASGAPVASGGASAIYRDQLLELEREAARGDLGATQAEEARREIARRLLAADAAEKRASRGGLRQEAAIGLALTAIVPVAAFLLYAALGRPDLQGEPLATRDMGAAMQSASLDQVAESLFQRLAMDPDHPEGWVMLARTYMRLGRYAEAAGAYQEAVARLGETATAELYSAWGEAIVLGAGGRITPEAAAAFAEALKRNPKDAPARFYLAVGKSQGGDAAGALSDLRALLDETPADAPHRPLIEQRIAEIEGRPVAAPKDDPAIRGMVDGLAARLEENPDNLDGWLLLLTSYVKLEDLEKARAALVRSREIFKADAAALEAIAARAKELGLE